MGSALSAASSTAATASSTVASTLRGASSREVDPDIEMVLCAVDQAEVVQDTGAKRRIKTGLEDFRRMYLATFVQDSRVSVFELYDCMVSVCRAFQQLQSECAFEVPTADTLTWARNLGGTRMQACIDEAVARTGMVDPRPTAGDPIAMQEYLALVKSWPTTQ